MVNIKLAISGVYGVGKDTFAGMLKDCAHYYSGIAKYDISTFSFADPGKEMLLRMYPEAPKSAVFGSSVSRSDFIPGLDHVTYRAMLKLILQSPKSADPDIWVRMMSRRLDYSKHTIITDLRFTNEFEMLKKYGFTLIGIKRKESDPLCNKDYDDLPEDQFDHVVINDGSFHDFETKAEELYQKLF